MPFDCRTRRILAVLAPMMRLKAVTNFPCQMAKNAALVRIRNREVCFGFDRTGRLAFLRATRHSSIGTALTHVFAVVFLLACVTGCLLAQSGNARITGLVTDSSKAIIRGAQVVAINNATGVRYPATTNTSGIFSLPSLPVGLYRIEVENQGFKSIVMPGVELHTEDVREINFEMAVGSTAETVTVNGSSTNDSPAVSMTVTREFIENMPLNGRSLQDLIQLAPGTVSAQGQYSIDDQPLYSNNFTVDGVSANLGGLNNSPQNVRGSLAGDALMQTVLGTTQSLVSVDALQEFTIQTSGYTAEYGRNPGGQAEFTTRSGTNDLHGTLFEYFRNTALDANSYQNNYFGYPQTAEHQNDFGGTLSGPLVVPRLYDGKNKTFYFLSYEGLRLLLPNVESEYVPTAAFRQWASPNALPLLDIAPLPNPTSPGNQDGCTVRDPTSGLPVACDALFAYGYSYPNNLDNFSSRFDQNVGDRLRAFVRYADTPSSIVSGAESTLTQTINTHTWTAGLTYTLSRQLINDLRFNYSHDGEQSVFGLRALGGSVLLPRTLVIPSAYDTTYAVGQAFVYVPATSIEIDGLYGGEGTIQHQYQIVDSFAWTHGLHTMKFGADWRRLTPSDTYGPYSSNVDLTQLADIQQGYATTVQIYEAAPGKPLVHNLSIYAEDQWKARARLILEYGLRWEFNPPPGASNGLYPVALTSTNLATAGVTSDTTQPYKTSYIHFAPRFGFSWNAIPSQNRPLTVRGGFGIFFDTGQAFVANSYNAQYPFIAQNPVQQTHLLLPLSAAELAPPPINTPLVLPYNNYLNVTTTDLTLPYTESWNLSVDAGLNKNNTLTVSYVGNNGRKLLYGEGYNSGPGGNPNFPSGLNVTLNAAQSSYNALQIQDHGRLVSGLDLVASFTYAHALDNDSADSTLPSWGNSGNDLRRVLNVALNYQTPAAGSRGMLRTLGHGWLVANRFSAQSGLPLEIYQTFATLPNGTQIGYFPDLEPDTRIYLHGRAADVGGNTVPGNWRLNPAAFATVPTDPTTGNPIRQGTLSPNYVRNPPFYALNTALQRRFPIAERLHLNFRAEAFNILNHPSLSNPDRNLGDSTFGELVEGGITTIGASNALYSMGSARSLQLSLKLEF